MPLTPVDVDTGRETGKTVDAWLIWLIAIVAIGLPMIVLVCVSSIPVGRLDFGDLRTALGRGEFLVPVLIMHAETVRRWTREVPCPNLYWREGQVVACLVCVLAALVCFAATVIAAVDPVTRASSRSLETITLYGLFAALVFGTVAVVAKPGSGR
jgi:hypothetical protein